LVKKKKRIPLFLKESGAVTLCSQEMFAAVGHDVDSASAGKTKFGRMWALADSPLLGDRGA
jgi:hypothetical protein